MAINVLFFCGCQPEEKLRALSLAGKLETKVTVHQMNGDNKGGLIHRKEVELWENAR